jgi:hypothetical protein
VAAHTRQFKTSSQGADGMAKFVPEGRNESSTGTNGLPVSTRVTADLALGDPNSTNERGYAPVHGLNEMG